MNNIGKRTIWGVTLLFLVSIGLELLYPALARAALSVTVKNETGYDLAEVKYVQEVGNAKILAARTGQLSNGASYTFSLKDSGTYRIYASLIMDRKKAYAKGNANNLEDGGRYTLTLMKVMLGQGGKGMNFINKSEFEAIGAKVGGVEAETEKSAHVISTYFGFEDKPSIRDIECCDLCKEEGHDCGFYSGTKGKISFRMTLQSKGIIHNCICFVAVRKKASESRQSGQGITSNDMNLIKGGAEEGVFAQKNFAITNDKSFEPLTSCQTRCSSVLDIEISERKGHMNIIGTGKSVFQFCKSEMNMFCYGAKHKWVGRSSYAGYVFDSDKKDPLQFMSTEEGYVYVKGKGTITLPDGSVVQLPPPRMMKSEKEYKLEQKTEDKTISKNSPPKEDTSCEENCRRMFERGDLKKGLGIEECIKKLCND